MKTRELMKPIAVRITTRNEDRFKSYAHYLQTQCFLHGFRWPGTGTDKLSADDLKGEFITINSDKTMMTYRAVDTSAFKLFDLPAQWDDFETYLAEFINHDEPKVGDTWLTIMDNVFKITEKREVGGYNGYFLTTIDMHDMVRVISKENLKQKLTDPQVLTLINEYYNKEAYKRYNGKTIKSGNDFYEFDQYADKVKASYYPDRIGTEHHNKAIEVTMWYKSTSGVILYHDREWIAKTKENKPEPKAGEIWLSKKGKLVKIVSNENHLMVLHLETEHRGVGHPYHVDSLERIATDSEINGRMYDYLLGTAISKFKNKTIKAVGGTKHYDFSSSYTFEYDRKMDDFIMDVNERDFMTLWKDGEWCVEIVKYPADKSWQLEECARYLLRLWDNDAGHKTLDLQFAKLKEILENGKQ